METIAFLHYNLGHLGGSQKVAVNIANELSSSFDVHLISMKGAISESYNINENVKKFDLSNTSNIIAAFKLNRYLLDNNVKLIAFMGTGCCYCLPFISGKIKVLVSEQSNVRNKVYMASRKTRLNHYLAAMRADKVVTLTQSDKEAWMDKYKLSDDRIGVIHNYCEVRNNTVPVKENRIITIGSFDPVKGYEYLVDVADKVLKENDYTWHLYAMGENDYKNTILNLIKEKGMNNFIVEQPQSDLSSVYTKARINVMTSRNEGLPLSLIEAKLYGCVNVSFDCITGPAEVIKDGEDGYLVECYDTDNMANKIIELINDEDKTEAFAEKAIQDNRFDKEGVINAWKTTIQTLLK